MSVFNKYFNQSFAERSSKILNVFTKTITDLQDLNAEIDQETRKAEEAVKVLKETITSNLEVLKSNQEVITKIEKIIS